MTARIGRLILLVWAGVLGAAAYQVAVGSEVTPPGLLVVTDPPWYEEPSDHNSFAPVDLTQVNINNNMDELIIDIPFHSDWNGLQLHVLIETEFGSLGAASDPFEQPVNFEHALRPDYALTGK